MKKIILSTLLLSLFGLPVFAQNLIFVFDSRNSTIYIKPDSTLRNHINRNILSFRTHVLFKKGYERDFSDINSTFEEWDVIANCHHYSYQVETIDFYNKKNELLKSVDTINLPFGGYSGIAKPGSKMYKVINRACQTKLI